MRKASLIACLLQMFIRYGLAQSTMSIKGLIKDSTDAVLTNATVLFVSEKDSVTAITKEDGYYSLEVPQGKSFELKITMKGYLPFKRRYLIDAKTTHLEIKPIVLLRNYHELEPVIVSRVRPVIIGEDTITYNAAAFHVRDGSQVEDILKRLPGVEVDMAGNVIVQGKQISKVMVDGKLFFGGDVLTATRNLPAEIVNKLQIIDDYGDKARLTGVKSGESDKVLNIVLKQDKRRGQFGQVEGGMGNQNKYTGEVSGNSFAGERQLAAIVVVKNSSPLGQNVQKSGSFSYADRWGPGWKAEGNISMTSADPHSSERSTQDNYFPGGQTHQDHSNLATGSNRDINIGNTLTYVPDGLHTLRITPSLAIPHSWQSTISDYITVQQDSSLTRNTSGRSISKSISDSYSGGLDLYYEQLSHHSKRRLNAQVKANYSGGKQVNEEHLYTTVELDGERTASEQHYLMIHSTPTWNLGVAANYFIPLSQTAYLEFGYSWHNNLSHKKNSTLVQDSLHINPEPVDSLRQDYTYHSTDHSFHGGYTASIHKLNLTISLDAQPGNFRGNTTNNGKNIQYNYFNWTPTIQASYAFSKSRRLTFQYNGSSSLPGLEQLQPVIDLSNPQYPIKGNPGLRPAYAQGGSLNYEQSSLQSTQFWGFRISTGYNTIQNTIIQNVVHPKDSSSIIQSTFYLNAGNSRSMNSGYYLRLPALLQKRLRITLNGQLIINKTPSMTDNILHLTTSLNSSQTVHLQFIIPEYVESDLSGNYSLTHTWYSAGGGTPIFFTGAEWSLNNRHYLWKHWILNYRLSQSYAGFSGHGMQLNPLSMTASLQRQVLPKNRATISIVGYDLFNTANGVNQSFSSNTATRNQVTLTGRYFLVQLLFKLSKFSK